MTRLRADLLLVLCAALWGLAFLFQKSAMDHIGPLTFIGARSAVAAAVLLPLAVIETRRARVFSWTPFLRWALIAAAAFLAGAYLQQLGITTATVTNAGFITALYVLATPFVSWAITGRAVAPVIWLAAASSVTGTWLLAAGSLDGFGGGETLVALSAVFWALHLVITSLGARLGASVVFTSVQFAAVAAVATLGALAFESVDMSSLAAASFEILFVGAVSTALTFTLLTFALRYTGPAEAAIIMSCEPLFAAAFAFMLLDERLSAAGWAGAAAIFAGVLIVHLVAARRTPVREG